MIVIVIVVLGMTALGAVWFFANEVATVKVYCKQLEQQGGAAAMRVGQLDDAAQTAAVQLEHLRIHCRDLETKQRGLDLVITAEELDTLTKRRGFLERQNEVLLAKVAQLQTDMDATQQARSRPYTGAQ